MKSEHSIFLFKVLIVILFGYLYHDTIAHLIVKSLNIDGSYRPLIVGVILYIIWLKKDDLVKLNVHPNILTGAVLGSFGCFLLFAGHLTSTMVLKQLSMIPVLLGATLLIGGFSFFKILFIPICYLVFLTGFVDMLLWSKAFYFQLISANIAAALFQLIGMTFFQSGIFIELPHITLEVGRGCSGISHVVALIALSIPLSIIHKLSPFKKIILIISSFFIGLFANGLRIVLIGIYAMYNQGGDLHGPKETLYVTFIFFFGMVVLILFSQVLSNKGKSVSSSNVVDANIGNNTADRVLNINSKVDRLDTNTGMEKKRLLSWYITGGIVFITLAFIHFYKLQPIYISKSFEEFPKSIMGFSSEKIELIDDRLRPFSTDDELLRSYFNSDGRRLELYIGYSSEQIQGSKIFDARRSWMHEKVEEVTVDVGNEEMTVNKTNIDDQSDSMNIYFWYVIDGRIITDPYIGKFFTLWSGLTKRQTNASVVIMRTSIGQVEIVPFLKELIPVVSNQVANQNL